MASGVALDTASGKTHAVMLFENARNMTIRARDGGVGEVFADAAEQTLDRDHRNQCAEDRLPQRNRYRQVHRQQHAGDCCGKITDGAGLAAELFIAPLEEDTSRRCDRNYQQRAQPKDDAARDQRRTQRNQHIAHNHRSRIFRCYMRRSRNNLTHFAASFCFSASAFALSAFL